MAQQPMKPMHVIPNRRIPSPPPSAPMAPMPTMATGDFARDLQAAIDEGRVLTLNADIALDAPVSIRITRSHQAWHGLDGGMHRITSRVAGAPTIRVFFDDQTPDGTCDRSLTFQNFSLIGGGQEASGLVLDFPTNNSWIVNPLLQNLWIEGIGGRAGLEVIGSIFEGNLQAVGTMNCLGSGAYFANRGGGIVSALRWVGGTNRQNGGHGILVDAYDGPYDVRCTGLYFCENQGNGAHWLAGVEHMTDCGFENNRGGAGVYLTNRGKLSACTASTYGPQPYLIQAYVVGDLSLTNCSVEAYGGGSIKLVKLDGGGGRLNLINSPGEIDGEGVTVRTAQMA